MERGPLHLELSSLICHCENCRVSIALSLSRQERLFWNVWMMMSTAVPASVWQEPRCENLTLPPPQMACCSSHLISKNISISRGRQDACFTLIYKWSHHCHTQTVSLGQQSTLLCTTGPAEIFQNINININKIFGWRAVSSELDSELLDREAPPWLYRC